MARQAPPFFSLSVKSGQQYETTDGLVTIVKSAKSKDPNHGTSIMVFYQLNGVDQEPKKQYEFKQWIFNILKDAPAEQTPATPPIPPATDTTASNPPLDPPPNPTNPPNPPNPPSDPPPAPKKRGWLDWMDDVYDFLFS